MADNTDNREGTGGEELPDDLKRLVDAAQQDAEDTDAQETAGEAPGHTVTSGPVSEEDKARSLIDMSTIANPHGSIIEDANGGEGTTVRAAYLGKEMAASFLEYSMSVIVSRALPDVRDGLKPVHRRILYAMNESGIFPNRPHKKSAWTVSEVIGKYHPHGDFAVYEAMVRLAQWFSMRTPLIDGHGNFGNIDGDGAAAMRYTESRLAKPAMELLRDLQKDTVDWQPNYDESLAEPQVLPARFPNLLVNGCGGIAVGMATNIPPHNLGEAVEATCMLIDNPEATTEDLMTVMPGPDFPTGAIIMGTDGIRDAYETGRGSITVRAKANVETTKTGRSRIVFTEMPYQVNKGTLQEKIAQLVNDKRIEGISDLRDESNQKGIRLVIELKKDVIPQVVLNNLYKYTQLQTTFGVINLALVDGVPKCLTLREMLQHYIDHQVDVVTRRTRFDLKKAQARAHILEGYLLALDNIDEVIHIIRSSRTDSEASQRLIERFGFSPEQTQAILEMRLRRLTGLSRDQIEEELAGLRRAIAYYEDLLANPVKILGVIKDEMREISRKFSDKRRTQISAQGTKELNVEDLIAEEDMVVTVTHAGYVKRTPLDTYRSQKRGGKGVQGVNLKDEDFVEDLFVASTHDYVLFFSNKGKVYRLKVHELPIGQRTARGTAMVNLVPFEDGERAAAVITCRTFPDDEYLMFATANGTVKKTAMSAYDRTRRDGIIAINLREGDELVNVRRVKEGEKVMLVSTDGKAIMFPESDVRPMGRDTSGVRGITLKDGAKMLGMEITNGNGDLFVITEKGYGKRTPVSDYPEHKRGGQGVFTITMTEKKGNLVACRIVGPQHELMIMSNEGVVIRVKSKDISRLGRSTQGVKVMNLGDDDAVSAIARMAVAKRKPEAGEGADDEDQGALTLAGEEEVDEDLLDE